MVFEVGDLVVSPSHGAARIVKREAREVGGALREYVTLFVMDSELTISLPLDGAEASGLRAVANEAVLGEISSTLQAPAGEEDATFARRFRANKDKLKGGKLVEIAEVVRDLTARTALRGISTGERQLLQQARRRLAAEVQLTRGASEDEAQSWIDDVLSESSATASTAPE
jgi:CarD family transcriptional regulator